MNIGLKTNGKKSSSQMSPPLTQDGTRGSEFGAPTTVGKRNYSMSSPVLKRVHQLRSRRDMERKIGMSSHSIRTISSLGCIRIIVQVALLSPCFKLSIARTNVIC